jgi:hypothetical protein
MAESTDLNLIAFRLDAVEAKLEETAGLTLNKLDELLVSQASSGLIMATEKQAREFLSLEVSRIEVDFKDHKALSHQRYHDQQKQNTDFQITLAQKVIPGAVTGGAMSAMIMLIQFLAGGAN